MSQEQTNTSSESLISDQLLHSIRGRAAINDQLNSFFDEDLADLSQTGYLSGLVPGTFGGSGRTLEQTVFDQVRLATAAPATAIAVNMHIVWAGMAWYLNRLGDHSLDWLLRGSASGEVYGFGYSEAGNNATPRYATTKAIPLPGGGYRFEGTKIFTSLSPAWTRLGVMGVDDLTDPENPTVVHAFVDRNARGLEILDDWDTLGMRATQSRTTKLSGVEVAADAVFRTLPEGQADQFVLANALVFNLTVSSVYVGIAERALELAVESARSAPRQSMTPAVYTLDAYQRQHLAQAYIELDGLRGQLHHIASEIDRRTQPGSGQLPDASVRNQVIAFKVRATEVSQSVVGHAIRSVGGRSYRADSELSRLYRDVLAGVFHPAGEEVVIDALSGYLLNPDLTPAQAVRG